MAERPTRFAMDAEAPARGWYFAAAIFALGLSVLASGAFAEEKETAPKKAGELFTTAKVWSLHLKFSPEEWAAMEPKQGGPGQFGGPPGGRPPGGGFGPSMFWVPAILKDGDGNHDGVMSREEFHALAEKWYSGWDKENAGKLTREQIGVAINASLPKPNFGPPKPGGGAGGPPPMVLQGAEGKRNGLASMMGLEFKSVPADLDFDGQEFKDVGVRYKGNGTFMESRGALKRSLKIELNKNIKGQKLAGRTTLNLHSNVTDASWMNEVLSYRLYRDAEVPAPRTTYARVFLTVAGKYEHQYVGLYSIVENIDKDFAEHAFDKKKGTIFKPVATSVFTDLGDVWAKYKQTYDAKDEVSVEEAQRVIDFSQLVTKADDATFAAKLGDYLDVEEFARYMAVTVWLATLDSILAVGQNYYVYLHPKTHLFQFIPWDMDHSFGQFPIIGSQEQREALSIRHPWRGENRFLDRVFKVEAFKKLYVAKLDEFSKTIFQPERFTQQVDELAPAIRGSVQEESVEKLAQFDKVVAGEPAPQGGFGGPPGSAPMKSIKGFVKVRAESVIAQLNGKSEGASLDTPPPVGLGGPGGGFNIGAAIAGAFTNAFDADKDDNLARSEFVQGFAGWFEKWNTNKSGTLSDEQLRAGIDVDLGPPRGRPPGAPGFGPPPGAPQNK